MAWTSNFRHLHNGVDIYEKFYGKLSVQKRARYVNAPNLFQNIRFNGSLETRLLSLETRLLSLETRHSSLEMRVLSQEKQDERW